MKKLALALAAAAALVLPSLAQAAVFAISPSSGSFAAGRTFSLQVAISSPDQAVNAVSGEITFPADILQVTGISRNGSVINAWVRDPSSDNSAGLIRFEGAILNPGYQGGSGTVLTVTFKTLRQGSAQVAFRSGSILANDGKGTNVFKGLTGAHFTITEANSAPAAPSAPKPAETSTVVGTQPNITSDTHPSQDQWSKSTVARFAWQLPDDATGVQYGLDRSQAGQPGAGTEGRITTVTLPLDSYNDDGAYYFHLRFLQGDTAGPVQTRRILVDRVPPETLEVSQIEPSDPTEPRREFRIDTTDMTSGIDHLDVSWDGGQLRVPADTMSRFLMPVLPPGTSDVTVRAVDKAGNGRIAHAFVHIEPIPSPTIEVVRNAQEQASLLEKDRIFEPLVRGTAEPGDSVIVSLTPKGDSAREVTVPVDENGRWELSYAPLALGTWDVTATARDKRGAQSLPAGPIHVTSQTALGTFLAILPWAFVFILGSTLLVLVRRRRTLGTEIPISTEIA